MVTIEQLRKAAVQAGMAKFYLLPDTDKNKPRDDMVLIGTDFLERLHEQLVKQNGS